MIRRLLASVIAGLTIVAGEAILNGWVLATEWQTANRALGLAQPSLFISMVALVKLKHTRVRDRLVVRSNIVQIRAWATKRCDRWIIHCATGLGLGHGWASHGGIRNMDYCLGNYDLGGCRASACQRYCHNLPGTS